MHCRTIEMRGYSREDGLYDIEGRITDVKQEPFQTRGGRLVEPNTPVHDMKVRLTIGADMVIREVQAVTDLSPFHECPGAAPGVAALTGASMGKGWRAAISERLGGTLGCTHVRELLNAMGSAAAQSMGAVRRAAAPAPVVMTKRPPIVDTCYAYSSERDLVSRRWPELFPPKASARGGKGE
jgi:hypothetical protein